MSDKVLKLDTSGPFVEVDLGASPPADPIPCFEQTGREVRLGSEVLLVYPAGDCDVAMVTGLERFGRTVYVQVAGQLAQAVDVGALAPFEDEDHDDEGALEVSHD